MNVIRGMAAAAAAICFLFQPQGAGASLSGVVVDSLTKKPLAGAVVGSDGETVTTDASGAFRLKRAAGSVTARALGYARAVHPLRQAETVTQAPPVIQKRGLDLRAFRLRDELFSDRPAAAAANGMTIRLSPISPKGLYMSFYGIGSTALREPALRLISQTELNTMVIDVKGDRAMIPYRSSVALAAEIGGQKVITVKDMAGLLQSLRDRGIYLIGRIVVFKDTLLAQARPDLAVRSSTGAVWKDREKLSWVDPFKKEVWEYNISIAEEAARLGFDEIQFDYVRFPDNLGLSFSAPWTEENRVNAITGFLSEASRRLAPYNVFVSADVFGYISWNQNDTQIGQRVEDVVNAVDYVSPMLYPSGFQFGIPGYRNPVANPYEIVYLSLKRAQERTGVPPTKFRPWLQAFRDYAFDRRHFNGTGLRAQIKASEDFGAHGWLLWNPQNRYTADGLAPKPKAP